MSDATNNRFYREKPVIDFIEMGARALFLDYNKRHPDTRDLAGLEMDTHRRRAEIVLRSLGYFDEPI